MRKICTGIDVGRSATKAVAIVDGTRSFISFPSAICPAIKLTDASAAARAAAETVKIGSHEYFTGETAIIQGRDEMLGGLSDDWAGSEQHGALIQAAIKRLEACGVQGVASGLVVVGLPARVFASQRKLYSAAVGELLPAAEVKVVPQPMGPYYTMLFDDRGGERAGVDGGSWAIIEVGQFTTDFAMIERGHVVERAFNSCEGMRVAAEALQRLVMERYGLSVSMAEATKLLQEPLIRNFGRRIDVSDLVRESVQPLARSIAEKARQLFGDTLRSMDGVRLAGGGAALVMEALPSVWSGLTGVVPEGFIAVVDDARFAVADGFARFGLAFDVYRSTRTQAQRAIAAASVA